jgi:hypothetical protein
MCLLHLLLVSSRLGWCQIGMLCRWTGAGRSQWRVHWCLQQSSNSSNAVSGYRHAAHLAFIMSITAEQCCVIKNHARLCMPSTKPLYKPVHVPWNANPDTPSDSCGCSGVATDDAGTCCSGIAIRGIAKMLTGLAEGGSELLMALMTWGLGVCRCRMGMAAAVAACCAA